MNWLGFIIFWIITLLYIWNGKDSFNKREWLFFGLKVVLIYVILFLIVIALRLILPIWPFVSVHTAKTVLIIAFGSLMSILGMKFLVVMLCTMFSRIMGFHQQHNTAENYETLSSLSNNFGPSLLILAKCLVSAGSILIFYGIWIGATY